MLGLDPKAVAAVQSATRHITGVITVDYKESTMVIKLSSVNPEAAAAIPGLLQSFSGALAQQLQTFFAITGEIIEVNKDETVRPETD